MNTINWMRKKIYQRKLEKLKTQIDLLKFEGLVMFEKAFRLSEIVSSYQHKIKDIDEKSQFEKIVTMGGLKK